MRLLSIALLLGMWLSDHAVSAQTLHITGGATQTLSGIERYDHVCVTSNSTLVVGGYNGSDRIGSGNLELLAASIYLEQGSRIVARGAGYRTPLCSDGEGPLDRPGGDQVGGRGGCAVQDSGGGGAHFGGGGRGTVDARANEGLVFPVNFEDDCNYDYRRDLPANSTCTTFGGSNCYCTGYADCGTDLTYPTTCPDSRDGRFCQEGPTVAGQAFWHNIYDPDFGGAGGDKGCRDGDGATVIVGGAGGGRLVLAGLPHLRADLQADPLTGASPCGPGLMPGQVQIDGTIDAEGRRGCGYQNDSGGGGAGGTVLVVGEQVEIGASAALSVAGGLGGDTFAKNNDPFGDCPSASQTPQPGNVCDDCGGGGGGGIISVLSVDSTIAPAANFDVSGAEGGTCLICKGEAGGGAGELQLDGAYVGEYCDGYDNDFDGEIDEGLGDVTCGPSTCAIDQPACTSGEPTRCAPAEDCRADRSGTRPRIAVVLDSSASMLLDLSGNPTFGDGSAEYPGLSTDSDGQADDARLFLAREAVAQVISAYPEVEFSLARYHQDMGEGRACQSAAWFECQGLIASYDDPRNNAGTTACNRSWGNALGSLNINYPAEGDTSHCINYAGSCGGPRRGADVLTGFGTPARDIVRWLDGRETRFIASADTGNVCDHRGGGDCELRATGPTPLSGSLLAMEDYIGPIRSTDPAVPCRTYSVILVTDGAESCNGDPVAAARRLHDDLDIDVRVIAVSVASDEVQSLNAIAAAGSGGMRSAIEVNQPEQLVPALTAIVAESIRAEICNDLDDDCDTKIDEDFVGKGDDCDDGEFGICNGTGRLACNDEQNDLLCSLEMPGEDAADEVCNGEDDDCDGRVDEGLTCTEGCVPEGCNGEDDDCDGRVDEGNPGGGAACGQDRGVCEPGTLACISGTLQCVDDQGPATEVCDGIDNDCDGAIDEEPSAGEPPLCPPDSACLFGSCRPECDGADEFPCQAVGLSCIEVPEREGKFYCIPEACPSCAQDEQCDNGECVDPCAGVTCSDGKRCTAGDCLDCHTLGCAQGEVCYDGACTEDPCADVTCGGGERCRSGKCEPLCSCHDGAACDEEGACPDACDGACDASEYCDEGECETNPCPKLDCLPGAICAAKVGCINDPCPLVACGQGRHCAVDDYGEPQCRPLHDSPSTAEQEQQRYVRTGGRTLFGCAVGASGGGGAAWWMLALCYLLRRRRPSRQRPTGPQL